MNSASQFLDALTRSLAPDRAGRIRSTTARINSRPRYRLKTSPHEVREQAAQLLARVQEFSKLNSYPADLRARVTLGLWDICLPLEHYFGTSDRSVEYDLACQLRLIAVELDAILFAEAGQDAPDASALESGIVNLAGRFHPLLQAC